MKTGKKGNQRLGALTLAAIGVVFGDIGTSPLYAVRECFAPGHGLLLTQQNLFGVLSLIFWSLTIVVAFKYLFLILRAHNNGEGGMTALLALLGPKLEGRKRKVFLMGLGLLGVALMSADSVITPVISVLGAVEGLQVATPAFEPVIIPLALGILVALFYVQKNGTGKVGAVFGPATLIWFFSIAITGVVWILRNPAILEALNPYWAVRFFAENHIHGFVVFGAVVLCITGGEAIYADMGHFGTKPIRLAWFLVVFPALVLNYFGQGAYLLTQGAGGLESPFFGMVSGWLLYPYVMIATAAAVIASQAVITGAYSLTHQAIQLGYLPRMTVIHTSRTTEGQIYVPSVNTWLMISCIALLLVFKSSSGLASAYGIAVTGTMIITTILFYEIARHHWGWSRWKAFLILIGFFAIDAMFFGANLIKIAHGGWVPISIGICVFVLMSTWQKGRLILARYMLSQSEPLPAFIKKIATENVPRTPGTAFFLTPNLNVAPSTLLLHLRHNRVLHERVVLLSVVVEHVPDISTLQRVRVTELEGGFFQAVVRYGFMQRPNIPEILICCQSAGLQVEIQEISFFLGRDSLVITHEGEMMRWRKALFAFMSRNSRPAAMYYEIPAERIVELGSHIPI